MVFDVVRRRGSRHGAARGGMPLKGRLRGEPNPRTSSDANDLPEVIPPKDSWRRRRHDHVEALAVGEAAAEAKRRLGVGVLQHGAPSSKFKPQLESRMATDDQRGSAIGS